MAELPTPHSIAIGTLISLYSDPHCPLMAIDVTSNGRSNRIGNNVGTPTSSTEWSLRLMSLIQQLVLKEDEGVVVLPTNNNNSTTNQSLLNDTINPADENNQLNTTQQTSLSTIQTSSKDQSNPNDKSNIILNDDEYYIKKYEMLLSGTGTDVEHIFNDVLSASSRQSDINVVGNTSESGERDDQQRQQVVNGTLNFSMESLSTLLNRIDNLYYNNITSTNSCTAERSPPSKALLSTLTQASRSVDHLMDILDEWHALLDGTYSGYPCNPMLPPLLCSIDGESSFGVYLRKLCLGMEEIPFEALSRLWDALRKFVKDEEQISDNTLVKRWWVKKDKEEEKNDNKYIGSSGYSYTADWLPSSPQIERIVRNTCLKYNLDSTSLLQSIHGSGSNGGSLSGSTSSGKQQQQQLHNLLSTHPECPSLHFLLYLTSLANGHRSQAIESLHRYFDYAMIHERKERAERALMIQVSGGAEGSASATTANRGMMGTMASGMGGITGGMTGGIINGTIQTTTQQQQQQRPGANTGGGNSGTPQTIYKESNVMQYAAILLAQTYYRFGYTKLSLQATEEAIRVAQQSGDGECVCFANGWLALVSSSLGSGGIRSSDGGDGIGSSSNSGGASGSIFASVGGLDCTLGRDVGNYRPLGPSSQTSGIGGNNVLNSSSEEESMLQRCQESASQRGMSSLAAGASLELARRLAYQRQGQSDTPDDNTDEGRGSSSLAWNSIQSAGRTPNVTTASQGRGGGHGGTSTAVTGSSSGQASTDIYNMSHTEATSILGRQNTAVAGLWESTGHMSLASLSSCAALYGNGGDMNGSSEVGGSELDFLAMNRVLTSFTNGPGLDIWSGGEREKTVNQHCGSTYATVLNHLVSLSDDNSERTLVASSTLHEWSVRSYDLSLAQGLNTLLANHAAFPSSSASGGALPAVEASLVFLAQSTHLFCQRGEYDKAKVASRRACWLANRHGLLYHLGWNLLQLSLINLESSPADAPERALPPLMECLDLAKRYAMDPLRAVALATLAKVLLCMGGKRYGKARAFLKASMPLILQHGHIWFQGEVYLTLAKCTIAEISANSKVHDSVELHKTAVAELKKAGSYFEKIEDIQRLRQVHYLLARMYNSIPNAKKERDIAAKMFARLSIAKNEHVGNSVIETSSSGGDKQWSVLQGVLITDAKELRQCVSMKDQR